MNNAIRTVYARRRRKPSKKHKKPRARRKPSISRLKAIAWKNFSIYIRKKYADYTGMVRCVTCKTKGAWDTMHASHLVAGRHNSILFDERGVYPCCYRCNIHLGGNVLEYVRFMESKHGVDSARAIIDNLRYLNHQTKSWTADELIDISNTYEQKWRAL